MCFFVDKSKYSVAMALLQLIGLSFSLQGRPGVILDCACSCDLCCCCLFLSCSPMLIFLGFYLSANVHS